MSTSKKRKPDGSTAIKQASLWSFWGSTWTKTASDPQKKQNKADDATKGTNEEKASTTKTTANTIEKRLKTSSKANADPPSNPPLSEDEKRQRHESNPFQVASKGVINPAISQSKSSETETTTSISSKSPQTSRQRSTRPTQASPMAKDPPLSEYERLRQRNIERNHARLAALGLVNPLQNRKKKHNPGSRPKQRPAKELPQRSQPTRRSTRHSGDNVAAPLAFHSDTFPEDLGGRLPSPRKMVPQTVEYTHSPLYLYDMEQKTAATKSLFGTSQKSTVGFAGNMTSLQMTGLRCISPKGLTSIYSLDFYQRQWLVGAGKSGMIALWNVSNADDANNDNVDPLMSWKGHAGRWIADARFLRDDRASAQTLITAGNDGTVCFWDLQNVSNVSGVPKLIERTGKELHTSGIFCMDVGKKNDATICTGSKDKTIAIFQAESYRKHSRAPLWTSTFHSAKVGAVQLKRNDTTILASASDDGLVAIHDYRVEGGNGVVASIEMHRKPHSVAWHPNDDNLLATAGLDPMIHVWDWRHLNKPLTTLEGHVPVGTKCKRIHRPVFVPWDNGGNASNKMSYLLSGGQGSASLSTFQIATNRDSNALQTSLHSRGELPADCGDAGCIAVQEGGLVAVSVEQGEILLLKPSIKQ